MTVSGNLGDRIRVLGWRQSDFVPESKTADFINASMDKAPDGPIGQLRLAVITHICDLVRSPAQEPYAELLVCRKINQADPLCCNGRNPRILQIPTSNDDCFEFNIHERFRVDKKELVSCRPDPGTGFKENQRAILTKWISRRYNRQPFPDAFNKRLSRQGKRIKKLLKGKAARRVSFILISGAEEERSPGDAYYIHIIAAVPESQEDDYVFEGEFEKCLSKCPDIVVENIETLSENDITLSMLRFYRRYDSDFYSLEDDDSVVRPPEQVDSM